MALMDKLAGKEPETARRLHAGAALLPRLRPGLVPERDGPKRLACALRPIRTRPGKYRVNGVVSNMPEFQKAFGCRTGQPMVRGPACRVW